MTPMRRFVPLLIAGAAFIAAACSDAVAPKRSTTVRTRALPPVSAFRGGPASYSDAANDDSESVARTVVFTLSPAGGVAKIGGYTLGYPANAVCDPSVTAYGPDEWKNPCVTLDEPITITAKYWTEDGRLHADFSPDIRFDPSKTVVIATYVKELVGAELSSDEVTSFSMWYSARIGDTRYFIDDGAVDPDVATRFGQSEDGKSNGRVSRRVYHFSGYFVREGLWCDDGAEFNDALCSENPLAE
jgi:hypothetical protein